MPRIRRRNRKKVHYRERGKERPFCGQPHTGPPLATTRTKTGVTCVRCRRKMSDRNYSIFIASRKKKYKDEDYVLPDPTPENIQRAEKIGRERKKRQYDEWGLQASDRR